MDEFTTLSDHLDSDRKVGYFLWLFVLVFGMGGWLVWKWYALPIAILIAFIITYIYTIRKNVLAESDERNSSSPKIAETVFAQKITRFIGKITGIQQKVKWSRGKMIQVYGPPIYGHHNIFIDYNFNVAVFLPKADRSLHVLIGDIVRAHRWIKFDSKGKKLLEKSLSNKDHEWKINPKIILYRGNFFSPERPVYKGNVIKSKSFSDDITDEWLHSMKNQFIEFMHNSQ